MTDPSRDVPGPGRPRTRTCASALAGALLLTGALAACTPDGGDDWGNAPGENVRAGDVAVRYAHLEDPETADVYPAGSDVPLYVWFLNEGDEPVQLVEVSSDLATEVSMTQGALPVDLPTDELVGLGPTGRHLVLEDISRQIRAQDLVEVTLRFSDGSDVELEVEAIEVDPSEMDL